MTSRTARRIEVRLDADHAERLAQVLDANGKTVSEFVRDAIDAADHRERAGKSLALLQSYREHPLNVPPPEELKRELDEAACPGGELCDHADGH